MGYELKIGQAVKRYDIELGRERIDCQKIYLDEAPAFGEITDHSNTRKPSYYSWENFAQQAGLYGFFFDSDTGLLNGPDGICPLTPHHKAVIDRVCAAYLESHSSVFSVKSNDALGEEDFHFERLRWLKFWIDWALENCDQPVFVNFQ